MRAPGRGLAVGPAERVAGGPRGRLSRHGRANRGGTLPHSPRHLGFSPLALFVFLFPFVLGASGPAGRAESCRDRSGGSTRGRGGLPWPPQSHRGCRRSDGEDLPGAGLHRASNHSGVPSWLWGDRGGHGLVGEARWEGAAVGRGGPALLGIHRARDNITRPLALPCVSPSEALCPPRHSLPVFYFFYPKIVMLAEGICRAGQQPVVALATAARCHPFSHVGHSGPRGTPQSPRVALCHLQGWGTPSSVWPWGEGDTHQARDRRTDGG